MEKEYYIKDTMKFFYIMIQYLLENLMIKQVKVLFIL